MVLIFSNSRHHLTLCVVWSISVDILHSFILNLKKAWAYYSFEMSRSFNSRGLWSYSACIPRKLPLPNARFPSIILLNNVLSPRPERPHLHHFTTKWNKFSFDKPAGPSLAVELSQSNEMSGGSVKPVSLSFSHLCSGVFSNIHFIFHCSLIHFLQKMNSSPLTVNTGITENYKCWNQLLNKAV